MANWVRYPLPLFWAFPTWRACEVEVRYPPPSKGVSQRYLRDTTWKQGNCVRYPPLRYYLEKVLRDMGGFSHWAAKVISVVFPQILVDFQSISIDFLAFSISLSQPESILIHLNQFQSVWLSQKRRNLLTTGRWGKQHVIKAFSLGKSTEKVPPRIHRILHSPKFKIQIPSPRSSGTAFA